MLRKDVFEAVGGFNPTLRLIEDWDLWLRIASRFTTAAFAAVPEQLAMYRQLPGSLSSDAIRMFESRANIIENRSLYDMSGWHKLLLRRRIQAFSHYDAALGVREQGSARYLSFILRSLALWPFPGKVLPLKRYETAAVMLLQYLGWWPNSFRSNGAHAMGNPDTIKEG
jgi:hypothetical protein